MIAITNSIRGFAHDHDEIPAFHAAYLVATILSAAVFNLGFFALVIFAHMSLDFVKYRDIHNLTLKNTMRAMALESIGDIALFLLALTFSVYLNHTYMISMMSGMVRSELSVLRALGTLLPKVRIMENVLAVALNLHSYMNTTHAAMNRPLNRIEKWSIRTIIICTALLIIAVFLFQSHQWDLLSVLQHELIPTL